MFIWKKWKRASEKRDQERNGEAHRPGRPHQKRAEQADAFAIF